MVASANPATASRPRYLERFIISLLKRTRLRNAVPPFAIVPSRNPWENCLFGFRPDRLMRQMHWSHYDMFMVNGGRALQTLGHRQDDVPEPTMGRMAV